MNELEVIPWREPKEWAKASKYAEKLVAHEALAEMVASLRLQMNDPVNNGRLKAQIANSLVRVLQTQHALRTPKTPKKATPIERQTPLPPLPNVAPPTPTPTVQPAKAEATTPTPIPREAKTGVTTVAAILMFLFGALTFWLTAPAHADDSPATFSKSFNRSHEEQGTDVDGPTTQEPNTEARRPKANGALSARWWSSTKNNADSGATTRLFVGDHPPVDGRRTIRHRLRC